MNGKITIIMYHYVRNLANSLYSKIKGLDINLFKEQILYLKKYYTFITMDQLMDSILTGTELPINSVLLTFDDGYIDHYNNVFPILSKEKIQGCFFIPAEVIKENKVLDVNKIHYILAAQYDTKNIIKDMFNYINGLNSTYNVENFEVYYKRLAQKGRYDDEDTIFIKRILQKELPEEPRLELLNKLFKKYVTDNEKSFSSKLYMSLEQIKFMKSNGMYIGCHGYNHKWLNTINEEKQNEEIDRGLELIEEIGCDINKWIIAYPYGAYNNELIKIIKEKGCKVGVTIEPRVADLKTDNALILPRLDTNDLPKNKNSNPDEWTQVVLRQ